VKVGILRPQPERAATREEEYRCPVTISIWRCHEQVCTYPPVLHWWSHRRGGDAPGTMLGRSRQPEPAVPAAPPGSLFPMNAEGPSLPQMTPPWPRTGRFSLSYCAEVLHVTESRVSQIRTQALRRLRERLTLQGD
jgi:Sigma-70, region 4